jgi:hypothetical protein
MLTGEGSFDHPSPRRHSTGASFAPTTIATWKENAPATIRFPPRTAVSWPKTNHPSERHRAYHKGEPTQAHARHPTAEPGSTSRQSHLTGKQTATAVQPDARPQCKPTIETKRILMVGFTSTLAQAKELTPLVR